MLKLFAILMLLFALLDLIIAFIWIGLIGLAEVKDMYYKVFPNGIDFKKGRHNG